MSGLILYPPLKDCDTLDPEDLPFPKGGEIGTRLEAKI
jgi:hypothetical protein